jgi:hypothetical protein
MPIPEPDPTLHRRDALIAIAVSLGVTAIVFALTWRHGMDLGDEGYYWYGAQRVVAGEVPIRDFMAYDPARYYWAALVMRLLDSDGIFAARLAAAAFQVPGMAAGIWVVLASMQSSLRARLLVALGAALGMALWAWPYYKTYDHFASVFVVLALFHAAQGRTPRAWFGAGVVIGLSAIVGRNHGVYGAVAFFLLAGCQALVLRQMPWRWLLAWVLGVGLGFLPLLAALAAVPGFGTAFVESIRAMFTLGATNIPLPVPWPWLPQPATLGLAYRIAAWADGVMFIALLALPLALGARWAAARRSVPPTQANALLACTLGAIPYIHYAFARADTVHLALAVFPPLLGVVVIVANARSASWRIAMSSAAIVLSVASVGIPRFYNAHYLSPVEVAIGASGDRLRLSPSFAATLQQLSSMVRHGPQDSTSFLALPNLPGLHAILGEPIPIWEIYALIPRSRQFDLDEIARMKHHMPRRVLISNHALDGLEKYRYSSMHPTFYPWLLSEYQRVQADPALPIELYERSGPEH